MDEIIIKYSKDVYDTKITNLNNYKTRLLTHLDEMKDLRDRLKDHWDDAEAEKYYGLLSTQIRAVRTATERVDSLKGVYENASGEMGTKHNEVQGLMDEAESAINSLGIS